MIIPNHKYWENLKNMFIHMFLDSLNHALYLTAEYHLLYGLPKRFLVKVFTKLKWFELKFIF